MTQDQFQIPVRKETVAFVRNWLPDGKPRAAVQIVHGMAEHGGRYARFAEALSGAGYAVYAQDLPGHGRTARAPDELGHFADVHGWRLALQSVRAVQLEIRERHQQTPLVLFGHSMGSYLVQDSLINHGKSLDAAILSASSGNLGAARGLGLLLLRAEHTWRGPHSPSRVGELTLRRFNRGFSPARTDWDWLSRDPAEVDAYIADPRCGFPCSVGMWMELLSAGGHLRDAKRLARIPKNLPVLLMGGSRDPAVDGAKGPRSLEQVYAGAGLRDVVVKLYEDARHELLNDNCREQVSADVLRWLDARLGK